MSDKYHFIGIGGAGMSVVAEILFQEGMEVSGSDRLESAVLKRLRGRGITAHGGHHPGQVPADAVVVISSAVREGNPELERARKRGQRVIHRSEALALAARQKRFVAVAGAHGKTTTSAMLTQALYATGVSPSCAIGGPILGLDSGALLGDGDIFVAEADESDGSFLNYRPSVAVVTNIEADHLDHFGSIESFEDVFFQFASRIRPGGTLVCCAEDQGSARLALRARQELEDIDVLTYGRVSPAISPDISIGDSRVTKDGARATLRMKRAPGAEFTLRLQVTGEHNLLNAAGAWAAGVSLGADPRSFAEALGTFTGAGRRFELRGEAAGRRVVVDYAHHPTEIEAALRQARLVVGSGRVVAVFQPHLYSRTANFAERFAGALTAADEVILAEIFAAREDPVEGVTSGLIEQEMLTRGLAAQYMPGESPTESALRGAKCTGPGDLLILIGAGDINQGAQAALAYWETA